MERPKDPRNYIKIFGVQRLDYELKKVSKRLSSVIKSRHRPMRLRLLLSWNTKCATHPKHVRTQRLWWTHWLEGGRYSEAGSTYAWSSEWIGRSPSCHLRSQAYTQSWPKGTICSSKSTCRACRLATQKWITTSTIRRGRRWDVISTARKSRRSVSDIGGAICCRTSWASTRNGYLFY